MSFACALGAAHIHFNTRFGEWEKARTETHFRLFAENGLQKCCQCAAQISHGDMFVNNQSLDLVEHGGMGEVGIAAVHFSRSDNGERRFILEHGTDLHGRSMGTQNHFVLNIECVLHVAGGVFRRHIQRFKTMKIGVDFRTSDNLITHILKNGSHFLHGAGDRVQ